MKKTYLVCIINVFLTAAIVWLAICWVSFIKTPLIPCRGKSASFMLQRGASVQKLALDLKRQGVLKQPVFFIILAYIDGSWRHLQAGEYNINPGTTPPELLQQLAKGEMAMHSFTIVEGWTFQQMIAALGKNPYITQTLQGKSDYEIMRELGHEGEAPEGRFAADTYLFYAGTKDKDILKIAYKLLQQRLAVAWSHRAAVLPYGCPYSALIAASIIEKETALQSERLKISGIILRRMQQNMRLELDPTLIYGLEHDFSKKKKLTSADLKIDTVYNTYLHFGLPPTPISMPSLESIEAALHPASGYELYFVAKGDGSHEFSATFAEHEKAVKKYKKYFNQLTSIPVRND